MPYALLVAALLTAPAPTTLPARYMPLTDIKPGMKGTGKTVLKGTAIVEFNVEVIGVLRNMGPKQDMILVRCSGQGLEKTGVISGMSGSPIYLDGKLIGALAFAWQFTKSPIAGITPIEEMRAIGTGAGGGRAGTGASATARPPTAAGLHSLLPPITVDGKTYGRVRVLPKPPTRPAPDEAFPVLSPIVTPVMVSGASKETFKRLKPLLARAGCAPVQSGGLPAKAVEGMTARLEPGAVCAVSLVTGDLDLTAIGTVTDRVGDVIWAFGHPFYGDGEADMPLSTGAVLAVLPSQEFSFKFGTALKPVGSITADEVAGIRGVVGKVASTIPLDVHVRVKPRETDRYRYHLIRHPNYTPGLIRMMTYQSIFARSYLPKECHVRLDAALEFRGQKPVQMSNVYAGVDGAFTAIRRVTLVADTLINNDIKPVTLERGRVSVTVEKGLNQAFLESLRLDTPKVKPGETIEARVVLRPFRGEREIATIRLTVPPETPEATYTLVVCNASSAGRIDLRARPHRVEPRTLEDLFSLVREDLDTRHLYARLRLPEGGVAVEGRELPRLPAFALQVFSGTRWSGAVTPIRRVLAGHAPTRWVLHGSLQEEVQVTKKP